MATGEGYEQFSADFWNDAWVKELLADGRSDELLLFQWMWTGPMRTTSGLLHAPLGVVREFIGWPYRAQRFGAIALRATKQPRAGLAWFPEREYWLVKNYIRRRADRPNLVVSAIKDLQHHPPELAALVALYNKERGLDLTATEAWATYLGESLEGYLDAETLRERFEIDPRTLLPQTLREPFEQTQTQTQTQTQEEGPGEPAPSSAPRPSWQAEAKALKAMPGYPFDEAKDRALMDSLAEAYPQLDLAREIRAMKAWCSANGKLPLQGQAGPRRRLRNWMAKADEFGARRDGRATRNEPERPQL